MSRVTLIRPPALFTKTCGINAAPALGVAYVAGTLRAHGHDVTCIDAPGEALGRFRVCPEDPSLLENGLSIAEVVERIPATAEVIGVSCMFSFEWFHVMKLVRAIRARFPDRFLLLGGEHATADHEFILKTMPEVDACVLGEGEHKMLALVNALENGVPKTSLPEVAILDPLTRSVRKNTEASGQYRIADIDTIARPAWDLLPLGAYLDRGGGFESHHCRPVPMLASRGCPHRCTFCSSPTMWTTRWKARDVEDLIDEIKSYIRDYRANRVEFFDLTTVIDKRWIKRFCERLIEEKLEITWSMPSGTRTEGLTEEILGLIRRSGCNQLTYPLETGNSEINDLIKKKINFSHFLGSMRNAVKAGIYVKTNMIIGFPFHTYRHVARDYLATIRLAWIGSNDVLFHTFAPYPGSELHDQLVAEGKIVKDESYPSLLRKVLVNNYTDGQSWNPRMSPRELRMLGLGGMGVFYFFQFLFRPQRLAASLYRLAAGKPVTVFETIATGIAQKFLRRLRMRGFQSGEAYSTIQ